MKSKLDEEFKCELSALIASNRLPEDFCKALHDDNTRHWIWYEKIKPAVDSFNRIVLGWFADFCRIDLLGDGLKRSDWRRKWLPKLVLIIHSIYTVTLSLELIRQYSYDTTFVRFESARARLNESDLKPKLRLELSEQLAEIGHSLELLGESHFKWPFILQCLIIFLVPASNIFLLVMPHLFRSSKSALLTLQAILEPATECAIWTRLVTNELEQFARDSSASASLKYNQISNDLELVNGTPRDEWRPRGILAQTTNSRVRANSIDYLTTRHEQLVIRLQRTALEARFNQIERSVACRDKLGLVCSILILDAIFNLLTFSIAAYKWTLGIHEANNRSLALNNARNMAIVCLFLTVFSFTAIASVFYIIMINVTVFDRLVHLRRLRLIMLHLNKENEIILGKLAANPVRGDQANLSEKLEANLLVIIIKWRLAFKVFDLFKRPISWISLLFTYFSILTPIVFRLHGPYFYPEMRGVTVKLAITLLFLSFSSILPLAFIHQLHLRIFKIFWSLLALLSRFESSPALQRQLSSSSSLSILMLRRQVADSHLTLDQFACRILTMRVTYTNLIKIIVWILLVMNSIIDHSSSIFGMYLTRFLSDPFRLFEAR